MRRAFVALAISIGILLTLAHCGDGGAETNRARPEPTALPSQPTPVRGAIVGVVSDAAGNAFAERLVVFAVPVASVLAPPGAKPDPALIPVVVPPDADVMWSDDSGSVGEFRIPELPPGEYRLATRSLLWAVDPPVTARPGGPAVRVRVVPAIGVAVTARDADDGSAIPNLEIAVRLNVPDHRRIDLHASGIAGPRWKVPDWVERSYRDATPWPATVRSLELPFIIVTVQAKGFLAFERTYVAWVNDRSDSDRNTLLPGATTIAVWLRRDRPSNLEIEARTGGRPFVGDLAGMYRFIVEDYVYTEPFSLEHVGDGLYRGVLPPGRINVEISPAFGLPGPATAVDVTIRDGKTSTIRLSLPDYGSLRVRFREPPDGCHLVALRSGAAAAGAFRAVTLQRKETLVLNVLPGTWKLMVWGPKSARHTATVDVVAGTETVLDVP
ncbi:MAG: hypothetical protein V3T86_13275 [Planctomycetota bacterium]